MTNQQNQRKVYLLFMPGKSIIQQHVLVPSDITPDYIQTEWTYAIRYGADGFDLVNPAKTLEIIKERHPDWEFVEYIGNVNYDKRNITPK